MLEKMITKEHSICTKENIICLFLITSGDQNPLKKRRDSKKPYE